MTKRARFVLMCYLLAVALLVLWVPWEVERRIESVTFHGPTYFGWVWSTPNPRQRDGAILSGRFGARWVNDLDKFVQTYREHRESAVSGKWDFEVTKQFMHIAWPKVVAEVIALTALAFAVLLYLRPRSFPNRQPVDSARVPLPPQQEED
jgi:hypothetical protein